MDPKPFILLSYAVTILALAAAIGLSWAAMRRAERAADRERP